MDTTTSAAANQRCKPGTKEYKSAPDSRASGSSRACWGLGIIGPETATARQPLPPQALRKVSSRLNPSSPPPTVASTSGCAESGSGGSGNPMTPALGAQAQLAT